MLQQMLFPLRAYALYPGDVTWTEMGHRYSWRMKLRDKAGFAKCARPHDHANGTRTWEELPSTDYIDARRARMMARW